MHYCVGTKARLTLLCRHNCLTHGCSFNAPFLKIHHRSLYTCAYTQRQMCTYYKHMDRYHEATVENETTWQEHWCSGAKTTFRYTSYYKMHMRASTSLHTYITKNTITIWTDTWRDTQRCLVPKRSHSTAHCRASHVLIGPNSLDLPTQTIKLVG
jgi:hypothetical protein